MKFRSFLMLALCLGMSVSLSLYAQDPVDWDDNDNYDDPHSSSEHSVYVGEAFSANVQTSVFRATDFMQKNTMKQLDNRRKEKANEEAASDAAQNWNTWIAPYYRHSHTHGLGESGSTSRNNGGGSAFGADFGFGDLIIGGSFDAGHNKSTYHKGDLSSSEDSDFFAFTLYGDWANDVIRIYGGFGYSYDSRDLKVKGAGFSAKADVGTRAFTSALICEYTVVDNVVYVAPYAGVRHAFIDTPSYHFGDTRYHSDTVNIFRFPVGVKIGQDFDFSGFYIRPCANFYVEPVAGDTKTNTKIRSRSLGTSETSKARMTDEFFWNASLGVTAGFYGVSFTLSYDFIGSEHQKENGLSLSYNWCF